MDIYVIERKSPLDQSKANYAAMCTPNPVSTEQLVADMVAESSVTRHDVVGVLNALQKQIMQNVTLGKSTSLGDLGLFYYTLRAKKQAAAKDVAATDIAACMYASRPARSSGSTCSPMPVTSAMCCAPTRTTVR